jgi:hypothetical protein
MAVSFGRQALIRHRSTQVAQSPALATVLGFFVAAPRLSELCGLEKSEVENGQSVTQGLQAFNRQQHQVTTPNLTWR